MGLWRGADGRGQRGRKQKRGPNSTHKRARASEHTRFAALRLYARQVRYFTTHADSGGGPSYVCVIRHNGFVRLNGCWGRALARAHAAVSVSTLATVVGFPRRSVSITEYSALAAAFTRHPYDLRNCKENTPAAIQVLYNVFPSSRQGHKGASAVGCQIKTYIYIFFVINLFKKIYFISI